MNAQATPTRVASKTKTSTQLGQMLEVPRGDYSALTFRLTSLLLRGKQIVDKQIVVCYDEQHDKAHSLERELLGSTEQPDSNFISFVEGISV
jgi:hypothetical protein